MSKHTPGPWVAREDAAVCLATWTGRIDGGCIMAGGHIKARSGGGREEVLANTALIAAAPELLEACEAMAALADGRGRRNMLEVAGQARAAIRKATGKE